MGQGSGGSQRKIKGGEEKMKRVIRVEPRRTSCDVKMVGRKISCEMVEEKSKHKKIRKEPIIKKIEVHDKMVPWEKAKEVF